MTKSRIIAWKGQRSYVETTPCGSCSAPLDDVIVSSHASEEDREEARLHLTNPHSFMCKFDAYGCYQTFCSNCLGAHEADCANGKPVLVLSKGVDSRISWKVVRQGELWESEEDPGFLESIPLAAINSFPVGLR